MLQPASEHFIAEEAAEERSCDERSERAEGDEITRPIWEKDTVARRGTFAGRSSAERSVRRRYRRVARARRRGKRVRCRLSSKMLGGASQTVSKIRVKCNGT